MSGILQISDHCKNGKDLEGVADLEHLENQVHPGHALEPEHLKHLDHPEGHEDLKNCWDLEGLLWCGASTRLVNASAVGPLERIHLTRSAARRRGKASLPFDRKRSKASRQGVVTKLNSYISTPGLRFSLTVPSP